MRLRRLTQLVVLAAVVASAAGCIVVPAPYPRRVYAPPSPPACHWVWIWNHWECR